MTIAITFDFWDTLVHENVGEMRTQQLRCWSEVLGAAGIRVAPERLSAAFSASWANYERGWAENEQYTNVDATRFILNELELDPGDGLRAALVDAFRRAGEAARLTLAPSVEACLGELRSAGARLGIVCDVGMTSGATLRARLERFGLLELFDHWSFSDEVGWYKPSREIFEHALAGLKCEDPGQAAHVGDRQRTDVAGALAMGMTAVRYTGLHDEPPGEGAEAHHVVADHSELPAVLGII